MFAILDTGDLNLAAVRRTTIEVIKPELPFIGHNLLYRACTNRGIVYVLYYMNDIYIMQ
jgi:hypothetical protein